MDITGNITGVGQTVYADVSSDPNVILHCTGTFAGSNVAFEGSINSTNGTDGAWFALQAVRSNANTIELATGVLAAAPAYAWKVGVNGLSFVRVRSTAFTSGTQTWFIQRGTYASEPIPAAQASATQPVSGTVTATVTAGTVVPIASATATGTTPAKVLSAANTNATVIKASAGRLYGYHLSNTSAAWKYFRLYNTTTAPTVGTTVPVMVIPLAPAATAAVALPVPVTFATGMSYAITGASPDLDSTGVAAGDVVGHVLYL